ncbi:MAG: HEAT repeat domain-containing protein [Aggregatilineales bacterium]
MLDELIVQLESFDPEQRRRAIIALGRSGDLEALPHLAQVFRTDPDPQLRELARRAGIHIRDRNQAGGGAPGASAGTGVEKRSSIRSLAGAEELTRAASPPSATSEMTDDRRAYTGPVRGRDYDVSREDRERAKSYLESALTLNMKGDNARAMKSLAAALKHNPNLINDAYFNSIVATVTGLEGDGAIQMVLDSNQRQSFVKTQQEKKKNERISRHLDEARRSTWESVLFELILYALIVVVGSVLMILVAVETANAFGANISGEAEWLEATTPEIVALRSALLPLMGIAAVVSALFGIAGLVIQLVFVHYAATLILGGVGTFQHLLGTLLAFFNRTLPFIFVLSYVLLAFTFISGGSPIVLCLFLPLMLLNVWVAFKTIAKIGEAYDFGFVRGCGALLIGSIFIGIINSVVVALLAQVAASLITQALS